LTFGAVVGDELAHGTTAADFVLEGVDELRLELDTVDADDLGVLADEYHHILDIAESSDVGSDDITGDRFVTTVDIVGREWRLEGVADSLPVLWKSTSPLRGVVVRVVDGIHIGGYETCNRGCYQDVKNG
jgi:hypothetical protein